MNTEQQEAVRARGDLAVVSLQAIRSAAQASQIRLLTVVQRMQKMKLPMTTEDGKATIANVLLSELGILNQGLTDIFAIANTVTSELDALAELHGVARTHDETITAVVGYIRQTSPSYGAMTDEQIRKEFGL